MRTRLCLTAAVAPTRSSAQVPYERILGAHDEPDVWLTYSGTYFSERFS